MLFLNRIGITEVLPITLLQIDIAMKFARVKLTFCYATQTTDALLSAHTIAIQIYFRRLFYANQKQALILSTTYELITKISINDFLLLSILKFSQKK